MTNPSETIARVLVDRYRGVSDGAFPRAPRGYRRLGFGMHRVAILAPDGWVYKVQISGSVSYGNWSEWRHYQRLSEQDFSDAIVPIRVPTMHIIPVDGTAVIAAEFVRRKPSSTLNCRSGWMWDDCNCGEPYGMCNIDLMDAIGDAADIGDVHPENIIIDTNGYFNLIDIGE